ncbi:RNA-binding S4 domain-containing protein [Corynebacterium sp. ES2794-CONJ1]|uniref:RNA-binding S4 domain-containing protein n=1 Tax=unclassified Corynebacterium TaxID=2624378 RepID=UPI00216A8815|nr:MULTISPECIES: RNA-binding S4 domain-containing protein [unclassified Corynebacterium]MCS4490394.1 RNA-binding S4 domain-containing protein [Corynebacterium sp. ES2775-CONJ]MCS4492175.1 RNA-binding S4 domain-containing protein [Corynebacterium sp. ES2715-CONJ3]MCS4532344.1 RNA-binding S4 domain-containing protein [Corynebacterium sp. ES2730-CONJ]MCU9519693.1 RNA-binding S4 domain-containing protein [Corynebacterium sp. ES2794-CONJ1]
MHPEDIAIKGQEIKLGQFIKLANLVDTGGAAKQVIADGLVTVDGTVDTRRGKTLRGGEIVCVGPSCARVVIGGANDDDYFDEKTADDDFDPEQWRSVTFD